jgi:hypothetical protein
MEPVPLSFFRDESALAPGNGKKSAKMGFDGAEKTCTLMRIL